MRARPALISDLHIQKRCRCLRAGILRLVRAGSDCHDVERDLKLGLGRPPAVSRDELVGLAYGGGCDDERIG